MTLVIDQAPPFPNRQNAVVWFFCALKEGPKSSVRLYPPGSERYSTRALEAHLACIDIVFGLLVCLPFWNTLEANIYRPLLQFIPNEWFWGLLLVVRGVIHLVALRINGAAWWTPFLRAAASISSAVFFGALAFVLTWADPFTPGLVFTISVMSVVAHWYCMRRSGRDAAVAYGAWRRLKG